MNDNPESNPTQPPQGEAYVVMAQRKPLVTYTIFAITCLIYLLQFASQSYFGVDVPAYLGMKQNSLILQGEWWRFITPAFLHGSILHIAVNMYALMVLGPVLENAYGRKRYLLLYLLGGFAGNVISFLFSPSPSLGSSTAIFGLIAAQGVFVYKNRKFFGDRARHALTNIATVAVLNFIIGMSPGIDNWGHLGGFLAGLAFAWFGGPIFGAVLREQAGATLLVMVDQSEKRAVLLSAFLVGLAFVLLAAGGIYFYATR